MKTLSTKKNSLFDIVNAALVVLITIIVMYPLYFCIIASFSDPDQVTLGNTLIWIKGFTTNAYKELLTESRLWMGYRNTIFYTIFGGLYSLIFTVLTAYVLSKKKLPFVSVLSWYFFLTMFINGGTVPTYLQIKNLGLINNPLVMIVGAGVNAYNLIIARQYFVNSIPNDIYEAAEIDGAGEWTCFAKIALPLAKPIVAVLALYYGVEKWNSYYNGLLYLYKDKYKTLQQALRTLLMITQNAASSIEQSDNIDNILYLREKAKAALGMKYSTIFIASLPLLIVYPFLQKYFVKGVMIGGVKG